ncbi:MAG: ABC transporter substrate-binding protein [Spirochaetales bacterium]|nr:ABC transporter substrate-binding protein [Spirochaetales bacterium]
MRNAIKRGIIIGLAAVMLSCFSRERTVDLGFIGGLSGGNADLGEAGRNGAIMAVEEMNEAGGLNGRQVRLIIKDDANSPQKAYAVAEELVELDVEAIVGPLTSTTAESAMTVTNGAEVLLVSPTASAIHLAGRDDYLIRVCPSSRDNAYAYGDFMFQKMNLRKIAVIADAQNRSFSTSWYGEFHRSWDRQGGEIVALKYVDTTVLKEYKQLVDEMLSLNPEAVLFIANSVDVARLTQQFRKEDSQIPLVAAEWAATQNLITLGGASVEGLVTMQIVNFFDRSPRFLEFVASYEERFGYYPSFSSIISYDAARVVMEALKNQEKNQTLKESLLTHQPYEGIQMELTFDEWGDLYGSSTFVEVRNKEYVLLDNQL